MLNGINNSLLHHITDKSYRDETSEETRTFDLVRWIRERHTQWFGHILRMYPNRMVHQAVKLMHADRSEGDLLMNIPDLPWNELIKFSFTYKKNV